MTLTQLMLTALAGSGGLANLLLATNPADMVGAWLLDTDDDTTDASGATNSAATGSALNGTHSGVTIGTDAGAGYLSKGRPGLYAAGDFTNVYTAGYAAAVDFDNFAFFLAVQLTATPDSTDYIWQHGFVSNDNRAFFLTASGGELRFRVYVQASAAQTAYQLTAGELAAYNLVAGRFADNTATLIVNSAQRSQATNTGTFTGSISSTAATLGAQNTTGAAPTAARLQMAVLWSPAPTVAQLVALTGVGQ